jgi:cyclopropane fatty-acyl-phospholipid synthase-like methyltransferase
MRAFDVYQTRDLIGKSTLYINWGLWDADTRDIDAAARSLVLQIGKLAQLGPGARLLDVGFGYGDQLLDWCRLTGLGFAEGVNLCPEQTAIARDRIAAAGFSSQVNVRVGDAVALPFPAAHFTAVTAVECAFHFRTRERFFHESGRVLRPGGDLVLADFIGPDRPGRRQKLAQRLAARHWDFAPGSFCSETRYREMIERAGFDIRLFERVTERVIPPGMRYARTRIWDRDLRKRMRRGTWLTTAAALALSRALGDPVPGEYVIVHAKRRA